MSARPTLGVPASYPWGACPCQRVAPIQILSFRPNEAKPGKPNEATATRNRPAIWRPGASGKKDKKLKKVVFVSPREKATNKPQAVNKSNHGRVVKASDSKSDSLWERRFESYWLRALRLVGLGV